MTNEKAEVLSTLDRLIEDLANNPDTWENPTLDRFLEAMRAWLKDSPMADRATPSWSLISDMLEAARIYE